MTIQSVLAALPVVPALIGLLGGAVVALTTGPVLRALPEPAGEPDKISYRSLATWPFALGCGLLAAAATFAVVVQVPPVSRFAWIGLVTAGVLMAAIDARTTWLPRVLSHVGWILTGLGVLAASVVARDPGLLVRCAAGAAGVGAFYLAVWAISGGGFGFGDVRLAPILGAAAASVSWPAIVWAVLLGSLLGAAHGLVRMTRRRSGPFPYAPALVLGTFLALAFAPLR